MNILYVYADSETEWNCSEVRCQMPHDAITRHPKHTSKMISMEQWGAGTEKAKEYGDWCDVMIIQRLWVSASLIGIEFWKARGKIVIGDIDDGFEFLPTSVSTYPYWRKGLINVAREVDGEVQKKVFQLKYPPLEQIRWGARLLNGITTPSRYLTEDWLKYNPHSTYLPNYLDTKRYDVLRTRIDGAPIIIGWGGSNSHRDSWARSGVTAALKRVLKKYPNVRLKIAGDISHAELFKKQFGKQILTVPWKPVKEWYNTLATFDIGLIPLHGKYDLRRSPLKAIEYCLMGIPFIGSNIDIYDAFAPYANIVKNQPNAWERALVHTIENYHDIVRENKWMDAKELALSWDVHKNVDNIVKTYADIGEAEVIEER